MVLELRGRWPYSYCFVECCFQDLFNIARNILVQFPFLHFVSVHEMHPYSSIDATTTWKKFSFNSSDRSDFHMIDNLLLAVHAYARHKLISLSVGEMLLPRYVNLSINFRELLFRVEMFPSVLSFVRVNVGGNISSCPLQTMQL